jgi:DNA-directed RNA polymerase subunit RPC12/RpoP
MPTSKEKAMEDAAQPVVPSPINCGSSNPTHHLPTNETERSHYLARLEQVIAIGQQTFWDVGSALMEIRDLELYRPQYANFEEYCRTKWGFGHSQAYRLMDATVLFKQLSPVGGVLREAHARALLAVPQEKREIVLQAATQVAKLAGRRLIARDIIDAAKSKATNPKGPSAKPPAVDATNSGSIEEKLYALWLKATPAERRRFLARVQSLSEAGFREDHESYVCNECGTQFPDLEEAVTLYECGQCGDTFTRGTSADGDRQCPECNGLGTKLAENGCPECNQGVLGREAEEREIR